MDIEGFGAFRLDAQTVAALALNEGAEVDTPLARRIAGAAEHRHGRQIALRLLESRLRSRAELETGLRRRGVPRVISLDVIGDLAREGWIDDVRFARAWIRDRLALRPSGRRRLKLELLARGITPDVADDTIASMLTAEEEEELALVQARARFRRVRGLSPPVARRRLVGWLRRRGFGSGAIARALRAVQGAMVNEDDASVSA